MVVSNPVDVLTYLAVQRLDLPAGQRHRPGHAARYSPIPQLICRSDRPFLPTQVAGIILGEHGDSMVPIWSAAQAGGLPLDRFPKWSPPLAESILKRTRGSGAEVITLKGGSGFAVGISIREVVHAVALGLDRILPISSLVSRTYGLRDVCLSVPTVVGRKGVLDHLEIELWPKEMSALQHSAQVLHETIEAVLKSNKNAVEKQTGGSAQNVKPVAAANSAHRPSRVTMGSAGGDGSGHARVTVSGQSKGNR